MAIESGSSLKSIIIFILLLTAAVASGLFALFTFRTGPNPATETARSTPLPVNTARIVQTKIPEKSVPEKAPAVQTVSATEGAPDPKQVTFGEKLYVSKGCIACHSLDGRRSIGTSLLGIYGSNRICRGKTVKVDDKYLQLFMIDPNACDPKARPNVMPSYAKAISPDERAALVTYIKGLHRGR